jgi:hypothetical protein
MLLQHLVNLFILHPALIVGFVLLMSTVLTWSALVVAVLVVTALAVEAAEAAVA